MFCVAFLWVVSFLVLLFLLCIQQMRKIVHRGTHVEAGSNTSTVTLRVVGGDEKGSPKSEAVEYGPSPKGLGPKTALAKGQQHIQKTGPGSSSHQRWCPTKLSNINKYLVMIPRWG
jgi:hypothetical protein